MDRRNRQFIRLARIMLHDLANPIASLNLGLESLRIDANDSTAVSLMARGLQDQKEKLLELQTLLYFLSDTPESGPIDDNEAKIRSCIDQCSSQITTKEIEFIVEADSAKSHCFSLFSYENILLPQLFRAVLKACISKASIKVRFTGQPEESLAISFPADPSMVDVISDMFRIPDNEEEFWHGWHEILVARLVAEESGFDLWLEVMGQDVVVIHLVEKSKA